MKNDILRQVVNYICDKYNCKPSEVNATFSGTGDLKVSIVPESINAFNCEVTTKVTFKG